MKISRDGLALIKKFEGFRAKAYLCPSGIPTIGYGHTAGVRMGDTCAEYMAEEWLLEDIRQAESAVNELVQVGLNDDQFSALVCFVFNVGVGAFKSSTLRRLLNQGKYETVPAQLMRWTKGTVGGRKVELAGLVKRRRAEGKLWKGGV